MHICTYIYVHICICTYAPFLSWEFFLAGQKRDCFNDIAGKFGWEPLSRGLSGNTGVFVKQWRAESKLVDWGCPPHSCSNHINEPQTGCSYFCRRSQRQRQRQHCCSHLRPGMRSTICLHHPARKQGLLSCATKMHWLTTRLLKKWWSNQEQYLDHLVWRQTRPQLECSTFTPVKLRQKKHKSSCATYKK